MPLISVVIPVYGCRLALEPLYSRLVSALGGLSPDFEIVFVNDACPQGSWSVINNIALSDARVVAVDLSRNFGQIRAITAGLSYAQGDWVVVMDCDLQDQPEEIRTLYEAAQRGYDVVFARRLARTDGFLKKLSGKVFYAVYGYFTGGAFDASISNFSISRRLVMESYLRMGDRNRAFVLFIKWMGFRTTAIDIAHADRAEGKSSYSLGKQLRLATEIITSQSNRPLLISIKAGITVSLAALLYAAYLVVRYFAQGVSVEGWTSTVVSVYLVGGLILAQLGVIGLYLGLVYDHVKGRPLYLVREVVAGRASNLGGIAT